jgi:hypothetical protein
VKYVRGEEGRGERELSSIKKKKKKKTTTTDVSRG